MSPSTHQRENRAFASEIKFKVTLEIAELIRAWARARLAPDPHAAGVTSDFYRTTSLYFDTEKFAVFHRQGSFGRSKYRVRRYGSSDEIFLERKLKTRGLVSKRRSIVPMFELNRLAALESDRGWAGWWYHQRLVARQLKPVCQISYDRTARVAMTENGPIRLTVDEGVKARLISQAAFCHDRDAMLLSDDLAIVELKYRVEMPALFKQLVEDFALNPGPISKYRLAAPALGLVKETVPDSPPASTSSPETSACLNS